jgi:hypothetical protein
MVVTGDCKFGHGCELAFLYLIDNLYFRTPENILYGIKLYGTCNPQLIKIELFNIIEPYVAALVHQNPFHNEERFLLLTDKDPKILR